MSIDQYAERSHRAARPGGLSHRVQRPGGLSRREHEVIVMVTLGFSNVEIAEALYLSINSVKTYVRGAYRKIGATRRAHAVLWGVTHGVLDHDGTAALVRAR